MRQLAGYELVFLLRAVDEQAGDLFEAGFHGRVAAVVAGDDELGALRVFAGPVDEGDAGEAAVLSDVRYEPVVLLLVW